MLYTPFGFQGDSVIPRLNKRLNSSGFKLIGVTATYYVGDVCSITEYLHTLLLFYPYREAVEITTPISPMGIGVSRIYVPLRMRLHLIRWARAERVLLNTTAHWARTLWERKVPQGFEAVSQEQF